MINNIQKSDNMINISIWNLEPYMSNFYYNKIGKSLNELVNNVIVLPNKMMKLLMITYKFVMRTRYFICYLLLLR